jgi:RimJ/RimL family protein N-acetyltransferase
MEKFNQRVGFPIKNWVEARAPSILPMRGRYCKLEPLNVAMHAQALFNSFANDTENINWTYMPYGPFPSFKIFNLWLGGIAANNDPLFYSLINKQTNEIVGLASYLRIDKSQGVIEVGHIHFSPVLQRTTMATEVMFLMMFQAFEDLGYRRYEWKCDALNEKSRKAALRLGFTFEGIFRQAAIYKGRNRDTAWYSITDSEWPQLKRAFILWLDPSNFDAQGHQIKRLNAIC